jgi:23S rRNA (cytosine1962-C5)-methyltransferase
VSTNAARLKPGREKSVLLRHPWVFEGALAGIPRDAVDGALLPLQSSAGVLLGHGLLNRQSQITLRLVSFGPAPVDEGTLWETLLQKAVARRGPQRPFACRLVNAEADGLPGLIVDLYGPWLVLQCLSLGMDQRKATLAAILSKITGARGVLERSDSEVRKKEGLGEANGVLLGDSPPDLVELLEAGPLGSPVKLLADLHRGHKTGFYLDQARNRATLGALCKGREVLNLFCYSAGFSVHALAAGATRVVNVDASADALALARRNLELNDFPARDEDFIQGDIFKLLRGLRREGKRFDAIVLDPPKLAFSAAQVQTAARAYKDLNLQAMLLLRPGGLLASFSCSGRVDPDLFQKILFGAALDARVDARVVQRLAAGPDHPLLLSFPEGDYLKGLLLEVEPQEAEPPQ